ncbi:hypothetical protein LAZ67_13000816 [Cordylochernes scorpioides]|uniref:Uncharacterized protein n=1 Tax=Cordylochernes scorpioides TaxID=51811 RepID=A0ABY6L449_9ARAC|nr:hypothetical protein LAZ67_13000816 [Cordylochernes scorpioides]
MRRNCPENSETTTAPRKNHGRRNDNANALSRRPCVPQSGHCARSEERICPHDFLLETNSPQLENTEYFAKIKPPTYDRQTSCNCFETQFEVLVSGNRWSSSEKAINLAKLRSLRGSATEVLQSLPLEQRLNFERLVGALILRFGDDNSQTYHIVKLKNHRQNDETLKQLAAYVGSLER